jgi:hypothetical protein
MIKINLLPQKRARVRVPGVARVAAGGPGSRDLLILVGALAATAGAVFLLLDHPKRSHISDMNDAIAQMKIDVKNKEKELVGFDLLKRAEDDVKSREAAINRLASAHIDPANVLHELGEILTQNHPPTMIQAMVRLVAIDPNKHYEEQWDPAHVWLTSFVDTDGAFKLEGGAETEGDVIQLQKRMQASIYFFDVGRAQEERASEKDTGVNYFKFTITGRVAY